MASVTGGMSLALIAANLATALVAVTPNSTLDDLGLTLDALRLEAVLVSLIVLLAMILAIWLIFTPDAAD